MVFKCYYHDNTLIHFLYILDKHNCSISNAYLLAIKREWRAFHHFLCRDAGVTRSQDVCTEQTLVGACLQRNNRRDH